MTHETLFQVTIKNLKTAILLQQELYKLNHQLESEGDAEHAEYFGRAAFEMGSPVTELEDLFNKLGYRLPWQKNYDGKGG